ncbi:unnamed protein product [Closterium sp. Naga37s-1]|nr:unnamed protein product [Closterium sp. Naga37s-1]
MPLSPPLPAPVTLWLSAPVSLRPGLPHDSLPFDQLQQKHIRPHHFCLPVLKRETHRQAIVEAVTGGSTRFFLGTDSAPHERATKEAPCSCAGIFSAHAALPLYARAYEQVSVRCY